MVRDVRHGGVAVQGVGRAQRHVGAAHGREHLVRVRVGAGARVWVWVRGSGSGFWLGFGLDGREHHGDEPHRVHLQHEDRSRPVSRGHGRDVAILEEGAHHQEPSKVPQDQRAEARRALPDHPRDRARELRAPGAAEQAWCEVEREDDEVLEDEDGTRLEEQLRLLRSEVAWRHGLCRALPQAIPQLLA